MMRAFVIAAALALTNCGPAAADDIERVASRPPAETYAALRQFADKLAAKPMGKACVGRPCDREAQMRLLVSGTPDETLSVTHMIGDRVNGKVVARLSPGDRADTTRVAVDIEGGEPLTAEKRGELDKLLDFMIVHIDRGQPIPTAITSVPS